jgi:hypothetical protein
MSKRIADCGLRIAECGEPGRPRPRPTTFRNPKTEIRNYVACLLVFVASVASAQSPYPTTAASPQSPWGGYVVPQQVPYQPTLGTAPGSPAGEPASAGGSTAPVIIVPEQCAPPGTAAYPAYPCTDAACPGTAGMPWPDGCPPGAVYCETVPQVQTDSALPPGTRNGVFQKINFTGAWLPRLDDGSLGMTDAQIDVVFGLPFFTRENPLVITPTYAAHFLDGPVTPDLPPRLHDAQLDFETFQHIGERWILDLDVTVGEHADDYSFGADDALRITGSGAVVFVPSPAWKWVLGVAYVDRANTEFLPIAGAIFTPNDDAEYRLVFPAPKVSWRLPWTAIPGRDERWLYVGGEFGGGVWAVERTTGATDELDITDWRVFLGAERKIIGGLSRRIEVGYVFCRTLQYGSVGTDVSLDDTVMVRGGLTY